MNYAKFFKLSVVALALGTAFTSCDDNDGPTPNGPTASGMRFLVTATDSLKDLNAGTTVRLFTNLNDASRRDVSVYDSLYKGTDGVFVWDGIAQVDYNPSTQIFAGNVYAKGASGREGALKKGHGVHLFKVNGNSITAVGPVSNDNYAAFGHFGRYHYTTNRSKFDVSRIDASGNHTNITINPEKLLAYGKSPQVASIVDFNGGVAMSFTFPDRDSAVVAFADYDLKINKVIVDSRAGSGASNRKGFRVGQLELDDSGDLFLFGGTAKHDDRQVVLRIKKGTTEFDKSFALDFGKLTGNHRIRRALPLAAGVYVVELYTEAGAKGISAFGGSSFGVLNLTSGTYTSVTGLPAGLSNGSLYIGRGDSYNGKFYLPISGATGLLSSPRNGAILKEVTPQRATVYTFGADGKASTFMTLKSGNIIKGFTIVK